MICYFSADGASVDYKTCFPSTAYTLNHLTFDKQFPDFASHRPLPIRLKAIEGHRIIYLEILHSKRVDCVNKP